MSADNQASKMDAENERAQQIKSEHERCASLLKESYIFEFVAFGCKRDATDTCWIATRTIQSHSRKTQYSFQSQVHFENLFSEDHVRAESQVSQDVIAFVQHYTF